MSQIILTADLIDNEFTTFAELVELVRKAHEEAPFPVVAAYISSYQQKLLRLEAFEKRGLTNEQARALNFTQVLGTPVFIWDGYGMPPCACCGHRH